MSTVNRLLLTSIVVMCWIGTTSVVAQQATPGSTPAGPSGGYPVAIHEGTCDQPVAEPVAQLEDATATPSDGADGEVVGQAVEGVLLRSTGTVDLTFQSFTDAPYIVVIHASAESFGTIVACGQIAGYNDNNEVIIALTPVGDSTTVGVATIENSEAAGVEIEDTQTQVTVYAFSTSSDDAT